ncbi:MAG: hypothetical protein KF687_12255 [Cyclobacteriaceae bacterium]|nr:hypothetical protein [Cyclobacteriaceae bacterium]
MHKVHIIKILLLILIPLSGYTQKLKYKDIFTLLSAKEYEKAEPFLRSYINENKAPEPSSYLFMAIVYEQKTPIDDILKSVQQAFNNIDSALYFYDKAYATINEKEFKGSSKDYYASYSKRDLRTGTYGVTLLDVQFAIEKSTIALRERREKIKLVNYYFTQAEESYRKAHTLYDSLNTTFPGEREFYLRSNDETLKTLTKLSSTYEAAKKAFDSYKASAANLGKIGYNHSWIVSEIKDFKRDGKTLTDFYQNDLAIWDYQKFAKHATDVITKEIKPIRDNLVKYDIEINKLREKLKTDSVSVKSDLTKLVAGLLNEKLQRFDPDPLPLNVFAVKVANLEYRSTLVENIKGEKTSDVFERLKRVEHEMASLNKLDSLAAKLLLMNIEQEAVNYKTFVEETYTNTVILTSYAKAEKDYADRERRIKEKELALCRNALNWLIVGSDSVPLVTNLLSKFTPLIVQQEEYTSGIVYSDTVSGEGYFYTITPSRVPDVRVKFQVDKVNFTKGKIPSIKALSTENEGSHIFFILFASEKEVKGKYPVTVAKIYRADGLAWNSNYSLDFIPEEIEFLSDSGELRIKGANKNAVLDKGGKQK